MTVLGPVVVPPTSGDSSQGPILTVIQAASKALGVAVPTSVYGSTDRTEVELGQIANEMGQRIRDAHDWTALTVAEEAAGDGSTTAFDLPADYLDMRNGAIVWSVSNAEPLRPCVSEDDFYRLQLESYAGDSVWFISASSFSVYPAPAADDTVRYYYQSRYFAQSTSGTNQGNFVADSDLFRLENRVLELGIIYEWRSRKGLDFEDEETDYTDALARAIERDRRYDLRRAQ